MKKERLFKRVLSVALVASMLLTFNVPAVAAENEGVTEGLTFEQVDNSAIESSLLLDESEVVTDSANQYEEDEIVRVSIVLEQASVIDAGYSAEGILDNSKALNYLKSVEKNQNTIEKKIEKAADEEVDVKHTLVLGANIISADVTYSDIEKIENVDGVKEVIFENQYFPSTDEEVVSPNMAVSSTVMTGSTQLWEDGYKGAGARIAIIDTGLDIDHQSFDNDAYLYAIGEDAKEKGIYERLYKIVLHLLDKAELKKAIPYLNAYEEMGGNLSANDVFVSEKIPYAFNYVDGNTNVRHIYDTQGEHGSHVAGIAAANRYIETENGFEDALATVGVAGNAPEAQVLVMKVFGEGGGAYDSDYMAAIEDAIFLKCDSVNLSLGSGSAGLSTSKTYQDVLEKFVNSGTVVVMSAGNSGAWAEHTANGDLYSDGVNYDTAGSPGSFTNSLSVASVDNAGVYGYSFTVSGTKYGYNENAAYGNEPLNTLAKGSDDTFEYVFLEGVGVEEDYEDVDVNGKVVFVSRGTTSFYQKANIAVEHGAIATIIYNNTSGTIGLNLTGYEHNAPVVSIKQSEAADIKAVSKDEGNYFSGTITLGSEKEVIKSGDDFYTMSSFSSWGVPGTLEMKPEITAPGGSIYSVNGTNNEGGGVDQYELMSGTSMAAPQVTGMMADLKRYNLETSLLLKGPTNFRINSRALAQSLLMSTAKPMLDADGNYYSVLQQGSGLANVTSATSANSVITMNEDATASAIDGKVKAELGDDPERIGIYTFSFNVTNVQGYKDLVYDLSADVFTQATDGTFMYGNTTPINAKVTFTQNGKKVTKVTVKRNKSVTVNVSIELTDDTKALFDTYYTAGAYVEAYVNVVPRDDSAAHYIPVLAYYGSWTDSSMFDIGSYTDYKFGLETRAPYLYSNNGTKGNAYTVSFGDGSGEFYFGANLYANETVYRPQFASLNNTNGDMIKSIYYALIRNAGGMKAVIKDTATGEVYYSSASGSQYGAYYYVNGSAWRNTSIKYSLGWKGTDAEGKALPEGTNVEISLIAAPEYYCDIDGNFDESELGEGAFFSTSLTIDNTAPVVETIVDAESGSLAISASDNVGIAAVLLYAANGRDLVGRAAVGASEITTLLGQDLDADIYLVRVIDYAGNASTYRVLMNIDVTDEVESIELDEESIVLMKNNSAKLTATVNPSNISDDTVLWSSSDESVAVVSAEGVVTAVGVGSCVITAAAAVDEEKTATCDVTVIEINKELNGVVWDEVGAVWFSQFNTSNLPNYTKLAGIDAPINNLAEYNGVIYASDIDTEEGLSNLYAIDATSGEITLVGASSIAYTEMASAPNLTGLIGTYFNYIVLIDPETGDYAGAFNYLSDGELVGIAYVGSVLNTYYGQYLDMYYLLDSDGNIYFEAFIQLNGKYYYFNGADEALMGNTGIACDTPYFQSLYFDGEYTYASCFNEAKNSVTLYAVDTEDTGAVYALGDFADGVWPVAALCEYTTGNASTNKAGAVTEATVKEVEMTRVPSTLTLSVRK